LTIAVVALSILLVGSITYIFLLRLQLRSMYLQLSKRLAEHSRQPLSLALIDRELSALAANINRCLKAEENLRLNGIREEKQFKEMIANISHDLRTPLTAIKGYQQLIAKGELDAGQREKLQVAQKHADQLSVMIEHFFEYSYLLNTEAPPKLEQINLTNLTAECLAESVAALEESHLAVRFQEAPSVFALVDKEMTVRIIQNLIRNCVQHSGGEIEVRVWSAQNAVISFRNPVKDAPGLDVERLFDRFYTTDRARSRNMGLGLSIIKLLAEQMGGRTGASMDNGILEVQVEFLICEKR
jgi:signal transduction histidine kinase